MTKDTDLHQTLGIASEKGKWKRRAYWIVPVILLVVIAVIAGVHHKSAAAKSTQQFRTEEAILGIVAG